MASLMKIYCKLSHSISIGSRLNRTNVASPLFASIVNDGSERTRFRKRQPAQGRSLFACIVNGKVYVPRSMLCGRLPSPCLSRFHVYVELISEHHNIKIVAELIRFRRTIVEVAACAAVHCVDFNHSNRWSHLAHCRRWRLGFSETRFLLCNICVSVEYEFRWFINRRSQRLLPRNTAHLKCSYLEIQNLDHFGTFIHSLFLLNERWNLSVFYVNASY